MDAIAHPAAAQLAQERAYAYIKEAITAVRFRPGQRLRTEEIAQALSASRTPVREALSRLAQEGLVEREGGWGYVVKHMSVKDVLDLFSVREALELAAARQVVGQLDDGVIDELVAMNARAEAYFRTGQYENFLRQNRQFHDAIAGATGNRLLHQMLSTIHDRVRQVGALTVTMHKPRLKELLEENRRILATLRKKDGPALERAVRSHIRRGREHVLRMITDSSSDRFPLAAARKA
ncbi:MAG TPA: GntR family transcriptional regulator [Casimicrobiaceae bacterium]|jgi:DNA-binding GntR family transcriptional regulator|nr:GntR family transcriptional regulator [Casimicrobiaceae bacterium]